MQHWHACLPCGRPGVGACPIVEVYVTGSDDCNEWIQNLAGTGLNWQPISSVVPPGTSLNDGSVMAVACVLDSGSEQLTVEDTGGEIIGTSICSQEEQNGWAPDPTAEASDSAAAQSNEQQQAQQH